MSERASAGLATDKLIGEVLADRYQVEMRLGEGAMGAVYRARHVKVGRAFAVKVLHPDLLVDLKVAQRFEHEAELAGRLRHPNVIGVVDLGETSTGLRYMIMDFAEGSALAEVLTEAPMPAPRIINITRQLLDGLFHAHEAGLIHRDFKPENVIIERDAHGTEVPRIVDFGIAILREGGDSPDSEGRLTTNGLVLGTPHYMAPEQAVADPIDHRIDLFALGIVVYEMLCGKLPFDGTGAEVARANLLLDPPQISERVPYLEVDPLLEAFARRLMAKKREQRPPTAKAARELLDLIERDRSAAARALGVPVGGSSRTPASTAPLSAQRRREPGSTFDPPLSQPKPPVTRSAAISPEHDDDLVPARSRTPIYVIGGSLLAAMIVVIAVLATRRDDAPTPRAADTTDPAGRAREAEPPPADRPLDPPVAVVTPPADAAVEPPADAAVAVAIVPGRTPTETTPPPRQRPRPTPPRPTPKAGSGSAQVTTTPPPPPETNPKITAAYVANRFQHVGKLLRDLGPGHDDLWARHRRVDINSVMLDPAKFDDAAARLAAIERDAKARQKR